MNRIGLLMVCALAALALTRAAALADTTAVEDQLFSFDKARNETINIIQNMKGLPNQDLTAAKLEYGTLQADANAWLQEVARELRSGDPGSTEHQQQMETEATQYLAKSTAFVQDNTTLIVAAAKARQVAYEKAKGSSGGVVKQGAPAKAATITLNLTNLYNAVFDYTKWRSSVKLAQSQLETEKRNKMADDLLSCNPWPNWDQISGTYQPPCLGAPAPQPSPSPSKSPH